MKAVVERFLKAVGERKLDDVATMFAPGASIGSASFRNGRWVTSSQSAEAWIGAQRSAPASANYEEPVNHYTVHIDDGQLAFVRADATLMRDGQARSSNVDYFTLLRNSKGEWKFVNGSYTAKPPAPGAVRNGVMETGKRYATPSLVGAWRVLKFCNVDSAGVETNPLGESPTGVFVYTPGGQLSLHAMRTPPTAPYASGDDRPTDAERRAMLDGYFGYFGTYTITSDSTVIHHVAGGTVPSYIGTEQNRHYRIRTGGLNAPDTLSIGGNAAALRCRKLIRVE